MILVFEMIWTGIHHAPGNSATLQAIAAALPEQAIRVHAERTHLDNLRADPALRAHDGIGFAEIAISRRYRYRTHIVSVRRGVQEFATMWRAVRAAPDEPLLIFLISATPTAILAAQRIMRLDRRVVGVQVGMHGNLNDLTGWRSRNPLLRRFDLPAIMQGPPLPDVRYLVLEESIRRALAEDAPGAGAQADVLPHPVNTAEIPMVPDLAPGSPLRIGLVGQATAEKGIGPFLETARMFKARHPGRVEFSLVGRPVPGSDLEPLRILDHPITMEQLSREAFLARLAPLHYVFLPLRPHYYRLSASGALLDAITWLKPVIGTSLPIIAEEFARFGDIGHLCDDVPAMQAALEAIVQAPDAARYARQRANLARAREARMPDALARRYRAIIEAQFPR
ncbi:MAG: hypothetical protein K2X74_23045, partial [Acetobacteraceae bacterium]|nr:hypothetical protein [Acetobacteraceae bacterium]